MDKYIPRRILVANEHGKEIEYPFMNIDELCEILLPTGNDFALWRDPTRKEIMNTFFKVEKLDELEEKEKVREIFNRIKKMHDAWTVVYIQVIDEAVPVIGWVKSLDNQNISEGLLDEFISNPADQNGSMSFVFYHNKIEDKILISYTPDSFNFEVSLYGDMKTQYYELDESERKEL